MTLIDRQSARSASDLRLALAQPFDEVVGEADPVLVFERFLAARRKRTAEALLGGKAAPGRLARVLRDLTSPRATDVGHAAVTDVARHRDWPVDLGAGPLLEVRCADGTLVAREDGGVLFAVWLDGLLPFGDRRLTYRPRSELEGAEALTAVAAPFHLAYLRTDEERRNDRFPSPPDLEAAWRVGRVLDELLDGGASAALLDATFSAAKAREAEVIATWARRTGVAALLADAAARTVAAGGSLVLEENELSLVDDELRIESGHGASMRAGVARARRGEILLDVLAWDGRWHRLTVGAEGPATDLPPFDVLLDVVVELGAVESELTASVH